MAVEAAANGAEGERGTGRDIELDGDQREVELKGRREDRRNRGRDPRRK